MVLEVHEPNHAYRKPAGYGRLLPMRSKVRELSMKRILIIEDDRDIVELVRYNLANEGFQVNAAFDGNTGLSTLKKTPPDLLLLDLMLPKMSGLDICREIRKDDSLNRLPVLMLTARGDEADRVVGLEMGADDYVTKPFSPRELMARVQAAIRRTQKPSGAPTTQVSFGKVKADFSAMEFSKDGVPVILTANEIKLLRYFLDNAERVITREELLNEVWGYTAYPTTRTVDNQVMKLRQKLEADPARPVHFRTMHGIGYKFVGGS